jgi:hypothetical protein
MLVQFVLYLRNLLAPCYSVQCCVNLKTFNTPGNVKLFGPPGKAGGLPIVFRPPVPSPKKGLRGNGFPQREDSLVNMAL